MRRTGSTLIVEQGLHRSKVARFWSHVVAGPRGDDCWFWAGAIADDGYGRFWITGDGRPRVVRPHRDALALALRQPLVGSVVAAHEVCDNPICVRADGSGRDHVVRGLYVGGEPTDDGPSPPWRRLLVDVALGWHRAGQSGRLLPPSAPQSPTGGTTSAWRRPRPFGPVRKPCGESGTPWVRLTVPAFPADRATAEPSVLATKPPVCHIKQ